MDAHETSLYTAIWYIVIVLGSIIVYFIVSIVWQQRKRQALQESYLRQELNIQEQERLRIGRDLHDEIGPILWYTQAELVGLTQRFPELKTALQKTQDKLQESMVVMGRIVQDLSSGKLVDKGLAQGLEDLFDELPLLYPLRFRLDCRLQTKLTGEAALQIFRIVQELVRNTLKHAKANTVELALEEEQGVLYLEYRDDGKGFFARDASTGKGLGLQSIRNRTALLGGTVHFPDEGQRGYFFQFPIKH